MSKGDAVPSTCVDHPDPDMADLINPHWITFERPPCAWNIAFGVLCLLLGFVALTGNATVIYIFSRTRCLRNPSNALIVNLAVSDFCMMAILCPMCFVSSVRQKWIFGPNACRFYAFTGAFFGTASLMTMMSIALDRYSAICKPFLVMQNVTTSQRAKILIVFVWLYSFAWAVPPLFGVSNYVLEGFLTTCSFDYLDPSLASRVFILAMCIGAYIAPLLLIAVAYGRITWKVHVYSRRFRHCLTESCQSSQSNQSSQRQKLSPRMSREINTAKTTFIVVACWTMAWTPYAVISLLGVASYTSWLTPLVAQLPAVFAKTAAVYNPIVYALSHPRYRQALQQEILTLLGRPEMEKNKKNEKNEKSEKMSRNQSTGCFAVASVVSNGVGNKTPKIRRRVRQVSRNSTGGGVLTRTTKFRGQFRRAKYSFSRTETFCPV